MSELAQGDLHGPASALGYSQPPPEWLYVVRTGLAAGSDVASFQQWYDEVHLPRILGVPGFLWASRYWTDSPKPHFITVYAVDSPRVLESEAYLELPGWEHWRPLLTDWSRGLYHLGEDLGEKGR